MEDKELLENILHALNCIPNKKNVGKNGESSYDLASKLNKLINKPSTTTNEQPCSACGRLTSRKKEQILMFVLIVPIRLIV